MGQVGRKIVEGNVKKLTEELNRMVADEWVALFYYWTASQIVSGPAAHHVSAVLKKSVTEELEHATRLTERIMELGGKPISSPKEVLEKSHHKFPPVSKSITATLRTALKIERGVIEAYNKLVKETRDKDPVTHKLLVHIMEEEDHAGKVTKINSNLALQN
jgi:bacterioferritin